jgi:hypothetical protein
MQSHKHVLRSSCEIDRVLDNRLNFKLNVAYPNLVG